MDFLDEIEACVPALRRYARALAGSADRADDLVQDCLERAIRKRSLFRPALPVKPYLFRILLNLYRNQRRIRGRREDPVPVDSLVVEPSSPAPQPGRLALAEVVRAMDRLPDEQREALLLVTLDGLSYAEAAEALSVPIGTLMSRLARARAALKAETGGHDEPRLRAIK